MLPAGAIAMQVGLNALSIRQEAYESALERRALQSITAERTTIDEVREMLRVIASNPVIQPQDPARCTAMLTGLLDRYTYLASIAITDNAGSALCSMPAREPGWRSPPSEIRRRAAARDLFTMGFVERGALTGRPVVGALEPLRGPDGRRVGFISASIDVARLREILDRNRPMDGARAAIVDSEGRVIVESSRIDGRPWPALPPASAMRNRFGDDPVFIGSQGASTVIAPLHAPDLYIALAWAPEQPTLRRWGGLLTSVAAPVLIWLLAIGAGWFAIEVFVTRPLSALEGAARALARGEDPPEASSLATAPTEIRSLRRTLAAMAKTLRGREARLIEALAEERALLREVHHRVKNNLQMVASLLNIQARGAQDESESRGLSRAHDRVQLLALVHQRIYSSGEVRELRIDELTAEVARQLLQSRGQQAQNVTFDLSEVRADADRAVPLAFMIGEAIALAVDGGGADTPLTIHLRQDEDGELRFAVSTDATGAAVAGSARLIDAFARQLGASVGRDPERPRALWARVPPSIGA